MESISFESLIICAVVIVALWGFAKVIKEIVIAITTRHDREQEWDKSVKNIENIKQDMIDKYKTDQEKKWAEYDTRINTIENKIEEIFANTEAKLQEIRSEQCIITYCMMAVLDGLHQLDCNGKVTEATNKLNKYLNQQAHS